MKTQLNLVIILLLAVVCPSVVYAQSETEEKPLNLEWVKNDVDGIAMLLKLMPVENQNIEVLKNQLKTVWSVDDEPLGFGANHVRLSKGYGYSSVYVTLLTFKNKVAYYQIGVIGSLQEWHKYREQIIKAWKENAGPEFMERGYQLSYERRYEDVFQSYYRAVANELGEMRRVSVPPDLKEAYDYLTSPLDNSYVGEGICGLGGPVLPGKVSIDALIKAKRIDLIENVLRGYNPGGRIFAAIALLRMKRRGLKLKPEVTTTLNKVVNSDVPATTCEGCFITGALKPKDVVAKFLNRRIAYR